MKDCPSCGGVWLGKIHAHTPDCKAYNDVQKKKKHTPQAEADPLLRAAGLIAVSSDTAGGIMDALAKANEDRRDRDVDVFITLVEALRDLPAERRRALAKAAIVFVGAE